MFYEICEVKYTLLMKCQNNYRLLFFLLHFLKIHKNSFIRDNIKQMLDEKNRVSKII